MHQCLPLYREHLLSARPDLSFEETVHMARRKESIKHLLKDPALRQPSPAQPSVPESSDLIRAIKTLTDKISNNETKFSQSVPVPQISAAPYRPPAHSDQLSRQVSDLASQMNSMNAALYQLSQSQLSSQTQANQFATSSFPQAPSAPQPMFPSPPGSIQPFSRRPLDQVTCHQCGNRGHYRPECPTLQQQRSNVFPARSPPTAPSGPAFRPPSQTFSQPPLRQRRPRSEIQCFSCGNLGHYQSECTTNPSGRTGPSGSGNGNASLPRGRQ